MITLSKPREEQPDYSFATTPNGTTKSLENSQLGAMPAGTTPSGALRIPLSMALLHLSLPNIVKTKVGLE